MRKGQRVSDTRIDSFEVSLLIKLKMILRASFLLIASLCLILNPKTTHIAIINGLDLCVSAVLPNLFPFFVLSELLVRTGTDQMLAQFAAPLMRRVFALHGATASGLLLGAIGGYPVGAGTIATLYQDRRIPKADAERALMFCNNAGPAFLIGVIGNGMFCSISAGAVLYFIHIGSAILTGLITKTKNDRNENNCTFVPLRSCSIIREFPASITAAGQTTLLVCSNIIFFSIIIAILTELIKPILQFKWHALLLGVLELTNGIHLLSLYHFTPRFLFVWTALLVGLGGLCVFFQTIAVTTAAGLSCTQYAKGKVLQAVISAVSSWFIWPILPAQVSCIAKSESPFWFSLPQWSICIFFAVSMAVLLKITSGKHTKNHI